MGSRRDLEHALRDAAEALRAVAETVGEEDDRQDHGGRHRQDCFGSSRELSRLGRALLEAVEVVREAATHRGGLDADDYPDMSRGPDCDTPGPMTAPLPPYPPYPPYAPHAPFPPYPPYPPVVVIGGAGCGCTCQQAAAATAAMAPSPAPSPLPPPAPIPTPPPAPSPVVVTTISSSASASAARFPDLASLGDVEALLDIGESVAALVRRTFPHPPEGPGP